MVPFSTLETSSDLKLEQGGSTISSRKHTNINTALWQECDLSSSTALK